MSNFNRKALQEHERRVLCGLVAFYYESGYTSESYRDDVNGGIYEHKLASQLGYSLAPGDRSPPEFIEACKALETQGYVRRMKRKADFPEMGIWPTLAGLNHAENLNDSQPIDMAPAPITTTRQVPTPLIQSWTRNHPSKNWWQKLTAPQASILAAAIALMPAAITATYTYATRPTRDEAGEQARSRIEKQLLKRAGYKSYISPRIGIGFSVPLAWQIDDAIHVFGGGEIDLIRHYDTEANSISEGIKFALRVVQGNYVKYPQKEEDNYMDTVRKIDPQASIERAELNGQVGVKISYKQSTGERTGRVNRYWLRLHDRAKLEVIVFTNIEGNRQDFYDEARDVLSSIVIDKDVIAANTREIDK